MYLRKTSKKKKQYWRIKEVQQCLGKDLCKRLPFIHAFSGCDTSSRPYRMGKATTLRKLKSQDLATCADVFINPISSVERVVEAGDLAMRLLTGGNVKESLAEHRYKEYRRRVLKGNKMVCPEQLPPTSGSTMQHSLRVHHQIMAWRGNELPLENYGWVLRDNKLRAKITNDPQAPQWCKVF